MCRLYVQREHIIKKFSFFSFLLSINLRLNFITKTSLIDRYKAVKSPEKQLNSNNENFKSIDLKIKFTIIAT